MSPLMVRWKCLCSYDGTDYSGWQSQVTGRAVQDVVEKALAKVLGFQTRIHGSGRADAGVHAKGQVFHCDGPWKYGGDALRKALATHLPSDVQVLEVKKASSSFHARASATGKRYVYRACEGRALPMEMRYRSSLSTCKLDLEAMKKASKVLIGTHDFTSFGASLGRPTGENPVKNLWRLDVRRVGQQLGLTVEGSGFLYKMVRSLCGALFDVGRGRFTAKQIKEILESRERTSLVITAPPQGLCLEKVFYRKSSS
ncbi:MAG: tRNA pseudouridine(38-40) synthase TruA [Opitutales bacterium]